MNLAFDTLDTPIGGLVVVSDPEDALVHVDFDDNDARRDAQLRKRFGTFALTKRSRPHAALARFRRYFAGDVRALEDLAEAVALSPGGTPTQRRVWNALRRIPRGKTWSYGALASALGMPGAARAIGRINGQNPLGVVLPCHRVIGASGALTGYAGGLERKRWLLTLEGALD